MLLGVRQCGKTYIAKQFGKEFRKFYSKVQTQIWI